MSLRIEPVLTQACYIIGCSEKRKKCLRNQMDLKCSIIHKHFFFFCICTCSHSQIFCHRKFAEEGVKRTKIFACFSGNCPFSHRTQGARRNGGGCFFDDLFQSVCVTCDRTGGGGVLRRCEEGLL